MKADHPVVCDGCGEKLGGTATITWDGDLVNIWHPDCAPADKPGAVA